MRIPRSIQLHAESGTVHFFWRCHNKEKHLKPESIKDLYAKCMRNSYFELNRDEKRVIVHAFCVMPNHYHSMPSYFKGSESLSQLAHKAHSSFATKFNKLNHRTGSVAEGRPKTPLIENYTHMMRVHFYIEANPIRSKLCSLEQLREYKHCSYRYYAHGETDETTSILTPPQWYIDLGKTPKERQKIYRKLFANYIHKNLGAVLHFFSNYIGDSNWIKLNKKRIYDTLQKLTSKHLESKSVNTS